MIYSKVGDEVMVEDFKDEADAHCKELNLKELDGTMLAHSQF